MINKKKTSVADVYYELRNLVGSKTAEEIMDSLEGNPDDFEILRSLVEENKLENFFK
jgi:hypothetical protein